LIASFVKGTLGTIVTILVVTPIIVILGEIIPKLIAKKYA
jgi:CBS domain containing-hemolysin-like protein